MMKKLLSVALSTLLIACGGGSDPAPAAQSTTSTFFDYSLLNRNAGAVIVDTTGKQSSSWMIKQLTPNSSKVSWDGNEEIFYWDNTWVYLDKYIDKNKREYEQFVTKQEFCQYNACTTISTSGKQKYAPVYPYDNYTLDTTGYIIATDDTLGKKVNFRHIQTVTVEIACSNTYYKDQRCLIQNEKWWDDNLTEYKLKLYRNTWYAKGLGPGFIIEDKIPVPFVAYLK